MDHFLYEQSQRLVDAVEATYQSVLFSDNVTNFVGNFTCEISNVRVADPVRDSLEFYVTCRVGISAHACGTYVVYAGAHSSTLKSGILDNDESIKSTAVSHCTSGFGLGVWLAGLGSSYNSSTSERNCPSDVT